MNKTGDGRFIEERVKVDVPLLKLKLFRIKDEKKLTWGELGHKLNLHAHTISHDWLKKRATIPLSVFSKLMTLDGNNDKEGLLKSMKILKPFWGQAQINGKLKEKNILVPNLKTSKFAEFYGILLGDGCLFSNLMGLAISGDKILDRNYHEEYIHNLVYSIFGIYPSVYISKNARSMNSVVYSKRLAYFMNNLGFPKGIKYEHDLTIPDFIFKNENRLSSCIRGLMDTDGSLSAHPNVKIMIHLSITSPSLRKSILKGLAKLGIVGGEFNKGIMLYGREKISKFYSKIGFSNQKNVLKYEQFRKYGKVPSSKEIEAFIIGQK